MFGKISGLVTEHVESLTKLLKIAKLPDTINKDMKAHLITSHVLLYIKQGLKVYR